MRNVCNRVLYDGLLRVY